LNNKLDDARLARLHDESAHGHAPTPRLYLMREIYVADSDERARAFGPALSARTVPISLPATCKGNAPPNTRAQRIL